MTGDQVREAILLAILDCELEDARGDRYLAIREVETDRQEARNCPVQCTEGDRAPYGRRRITMNVRTVAAIVVLLAVAPPTLACEDGLSIQEISSGGPAVARTRAEGDRHGFSSFLHCHQPRPF